MVSRILPLLLLLAVAVAVAMAISFGEENVHHLSSIDHRTMDPLSFNVLVQVLEDTEADSVTGTTEQLQGKTGDKEASGVKKDDTDELEKHSQKLAAGKFGDRKVNVKQIDREKRSMDDSKETMQKTYQKLLKQKGSESGSDDEKEINAQAQGVLEKDEVRLQKREEVKAKFEADKGKAKERAKKAVQKSKEASVKKMDAKNAESKEKAKQKERVPDTEEGFVQKAAEDRFAAYKLKKKAAELQLQFAQKNATKQDAESAAAVAEAARSAAEGSEHQAIKHSLTVEARTKAKVDKEKTIQAEKAKAEDKTSSGQAKKLLNHADKNINKKNPAGADSDEPVEKSDAETAEKSEEEEQEAHAAEIKSELCSKKECKTHCKTSLCFKFCMKCKKIKSEQVVFRSGIGLVTTSKRNVHYVIDPAVRHAHWVDSTMQHLHNIDKEDDAANKFVSKAFQSVHCTHCTERCASQNQATPQQKATCDASCMSSVACTGNDIAQQKQETKSKIVDVQKTLANAKAKGENTENLEKELQVLVKDHQHQVSQQKEQLKAVPTGGSRDDKQIDQETNATVINETKERIKEKVTLLQNANSTSNHTSAMAITPRH